MPFVYAIHSKSKKPRKFTQEVWDRLPPMVIDNKHVPKMGWVKASKTKVSEASKEALSDAVGEETTTKKTTK